MKKLGLLVMPLMAMSILTGCSQPTPTPVADVTHKFTFIGKFCTINGENNYSHDIYEKDKNVQYTIVPNAGYKLPETVEGVDFNPDNGVITISEIKADININVTAIPVPTPGATHVVSFDARGGEVTSKNPLDPIESGSRIATPPTLADRAGYDEQEVTWNTKIDGTGDTFIFDATSGTQVVADMILYAQWGDISQFTVNFYNDDGNPYNSLQNIKVNYGDKVTYKDCPTDSTYDNHYNFDGWYTKKPSEAGAELFPFDTPLTGDSTTISIYAKHSKKNYHVTFDANGGEITSGGNPLDIAYMNSIPVDKRPTVSRSGYEPTTTWCTDKAGLNEFTFGSTSITDNTTLYAKWGSPTPSTVYTVTVKAGEDGKFPSGVTEISIEVEPNSNLLGDLSNVTKPTYAGTTLYQTFDAFTYDNGNPIGSADKVTSDDIVVKGTYRKKILEECSWKEIDEISQSGNAESFFGPINRASPITKTVMVNDQPHKVRIIGYGEDYTDLSDKSTAIGITFEFANLISDKNGYSLGTQWNDTAIKDTANNNYLDSSIRMALIRENQELGHILWAQKGATTWSKDSLYKNNSVLDMLPYELVSVLKTPSKYININDDGWKEQTVNDKLFLLSPFEIGESERSVYEEPHTTTYSYYKGASNSDRVKKQVKNDKYTEIPEIFEPLHQRYLGAVGNYAGYNKSTSASQGGYSWLRSPHFEYGGVVVWCVGSTGELHGETGRGAPYYTLAVAPAFCI